MRILLLGEYSGVHSLLAEGLRKQGHEVTIASNGDFWKDYPRDIDLKRDNGVCGKISFLCRLLKSLPQMVNYDIVQIINPMFLELKAERIFTIYKYLRQHNRKIVLCCMGNDYYYPAINTQLMPMKYSDYNIGSQKRSVEYAEKMYADWVGTQKEKLNRYIAKDCDALVAGAYEYWLPVNLSSDTDSEGNLIKEKLYSIPFPCKLLNIEIIPSTDKLRIFIGISKGRSEFKGTDVMLRAAQALYRKYPERIELNIAEGVPYNEYEQMINNSDVLLDQIYSYGPGMNALLALSKGIVCMTGAEPEHYNLIGETVCQPIINVEPDYDSVYSELEKLVLMPKSELQTLKIKSRQYIERNHNLLKIAEQYIRLYNNLLNR